MEFVLLPIVIVLLVLLLSKRGEKQSEEKRHVEIGGGYVLPETKEEWEQYRRIRMEETEMYLNSPYAVFVRSLLEVKGGKFQWPIEP